MILSPINAMKQVRCILKAGLFPTRFMVAWLWMAVSAVHGQSAGILEEVIRDSTRVGREVPLRQAESIAGELSRSGLSREAVDAELRTSGRAGVVMDETTRAAEVLQRLRQLAVGLPEAEATMRRLEQLDAASRDTALVVARGGEEITAVVPDLARRGRFLRDGGPETVAAIGLHGPDTARGALRLDEALQAGAIVVPAGQRAVTLTDFGRVMTRAGQNSWGFWTTYVQPHWKAWLASGALAAYLYDPQAFEDKAGALTEEGFRRLVHFVGSESAAAIRGLGKGSEQATGLVWTSFWETYIHGPHPVLAWVGTAMLVLLILVIVRWFFGGWLEVFGLLRRKRH